MHFLCLSGGGGGGVGSTLSFYRYAWKFIVCFFCFVFVLFFLFFLFPIPLFSNPGSAPSFDVINEKLWIRQRPTYPFYPFFHLARADCFIFYPARRRRLLMMKDRMGKVHRLRTRRKLKRRLRVEGIVRCGIFKRWMLLSLIIWYKVGICKAIFISTH